MKVNREAFLNALDLCAPGISEREIIEQSSCYLLKEGMVITYDDEVACSYPSPLNKSFAGAIQAKPLRGILSKLKETIIDVTTNQAELHIKGKGRRVGITLEQKIELPITNLEIPKEKAWKDLPENFAEGVGFVKGCAGRDDAIFDLTCIHLNPNFVEAFDNYQFARFNLKIPIKKDVLIRQTALKHILSSDMKEFAETEQWFHFRNPQKLTLSCRRYLDEYRDCSNIANHKGTRVSLPKLLGEAASRAEVFSEHNTHENQIRIDLSPGWIKLHGEGQYGWYTERKKLEEYKGQEISFAIQPQMLMQLITQHTDCTVSDVAMKAKVGSGVFVVSLSAPQPERKKL